MNLPPAFEFSSSLEISFEELPVSSSLEGNLTNSSSSVQQSLSSATGHSGNGCKIVSTIDDCMSIEGIRDGIFQLPLNVSSLDSGFLTICKEDVYEGGILDILYIMDNSGSMYSRGGRNGMDPNGIRFNALNEALLYQANKFEGKSKAAVVQFNRFPETTDGYERKPIEILKGFELIGPENLRGCYGPKCLNRC